MNLVGCHHDPVPEMVEVVVGLPEAGIPLGDVVADSRYAHRVPEHFALPLRAAEARLVMDLHPSDRGTQGTHRGTVLHHGNCDCPMTPTGLFGQAPLARGASDAETAAHDKASDELARLKLGRVAGPDHDGYSRVMCPALLGKVRCPLREASMLLDRTRPEILSPPEHPLHGAPSRPSPSRLRSTRRRASATTTPGGPDVAPMPGAARQSAPTPGSKTPPRSTSLGGGAR